MKLHTPLAAAGCAVTRGQETVGACIDDVTARGVKRVKNELSIRP
jgi:hypothetical protein